MSRKRTQRMSERVTWGGIALAIMLSTMWLSYTILAAATSAESPRESPVEAYISLRATPGSTTAYAIDDKQQTRYETVATPTEAYGHRFLRSSALDTAARQVAHFYAESRRLAPSPVLSDFLNAAGAPYWGVHQTILVTTVTGDEPLQELIEEAKSNQSSTHHFGLAELLVDNQSSLRIICMLAAKETFTLKPVPRRLNASETYQIEGYLTAEYREPRVLAMGPSGHIHRIEPRIDDDRFEFSFSGEPGIWVVEIIASGQAGPIPLAQIDLYVEQRTENEGKHRWPNEGDYGGDPAAYMTQLINRDRARFGLSPLRRSGRLDSVAQHHSTDMRDHNFVGHYSPRSGMLTDRLNQARVPRYVAGENVALNQSLADAHIGLLESLGHRMNILSPHYSEIGVGLERGPFGWYVTHVFSGQQEKEEGVEIKQARFDSSRSASISSRLIEHH